MNLIWIIGMALIFVPLGMFTKLIFPASLGIEYKIAYMCFCVGLALLLSFLKED